MPSKANGVKSPTDQKLLGSLSSPTEDHEDTGKVKMRKHMGLLEGVAIILGIIFGSGIFISPKGVIEEVDSVGFSLVVWILCGLLSMIGALCYAELGTSIPKSGGDYAYIYEAFGPLPSFLYLWAANIIFTNDKCNNGFNFANYVIQPFFPQCTIPDIGVRLMAASFLSFLNGFNVKATVRLQNLFMFCKIAALVLIILIGVVWMALGNIENFHNSFEGTTHNPGKIAKAFYSGIFSYSGWNYLNFMTEELKNPFVNLPRAIYISLPFVTGIYVLANMAYLSVLTPDRMVAVHIMTASRMLYVGARNDHFPSMLAVLNVKRLTPIPCLAFLCTLSLIMLSTSDIHLLIQYSTIVESFFVTLSVSGMLYLRWKNPKMARPIRVHVLVPIVFVMICVFLLILPIFEAPLLVLGALLITLSGVPFYYFGVVWRDKPMIFQDFMHRLTIFSQKIFVAAHEDRDEDE
ncbi:hypothetical protein NQ318_015364 [Aromia moschata]|uniref:Uncharacterized protein n=1 Tax=Aromia moschata TaxID=1265417 RepID=A0AAV8YNY1_9CUCU|nr:hypothetical protein NQ318_015364 [Aromia moschata]